jgi:hypothetical protein
MERREDIRAALHSLLAPGKQREDIALPLSSPDLSRSANHDKRDNFLSESWEKVITTLQNELSEIGIDATDAELLTALGDSLLLKPGVCRGLIE